MGWQDDTLIRLDELISVGHGIPINQEDTELVDHGQYSGWRARSIAALIHIVGEDGTYAAEFRRCTKEGCFRDSRDAGVEILAALRADIDAGYLRRLSDTISAEVFGDFLEMAQHLLNQGYKDPAASLTGAVLEDGLRRSARNNDITVAKNDNLNSLSDKCLQQQVFNSLVRRQISTWTALRDFADHGHFPEYTAQQVGTMIGEVRSFLANHLG